MDSFPVPLPTTHNESAMHVAYCTAICKLYIAVSMQINRLVHLISQPPLHRPAYRCLPVLWRFLHFFHVCSVTFYVHGGGFRGILVHSLVPYQPRAMLHLWNNVALLAFHSQFYIRRLFDYITTKTSSISLGLNLPRCLLDQSRFTVLPSPAAASNNSEIAEATHSYAMWINRQWGAKGRVMRYRNRHTICLPNSQSVTGHLPLARFAGRLH